jgi:peptidoglycan/xylan/chitin deacetylase (PgdA/CDA1 family)
MRRLKRKKDIKKTASLSNFFGLVFVIILVFFMSKYLFIGKQKKISEKQMAAQYYEPAVFEKPKNLQTSNKIISTVPKKEFHIPIIMYHYVEYVKDPLDTIRQSLDINPYVFEQELKELNANDYKTLFVKEVPQILSEKKYFNPKNVVLTFDDGYEDFYTDVFPLLKKYQIKATVFIIYDFIGVRGFLNEKEIKELVASKLVEIGSHTLDHYYLKRSTKVTSYNQIFESKKKLEEMLKTKIESFAYPYGAFDQDIIDLVRSAGYTSAVSVIPGMKHSVDDLFYLYRVRAGSFSFENIISYLESYKK